MTDIPSANNEAPERSEQAPGAHGPSSEVLTSPELNLPSAWETPEFLHPRLRALQPIVDTFKLLRRNTEWPATQADWVAVATAPFLAGMVALLAYLILPIGPAFQTAEVNIGLMFILGISSLGIYGIVLGNWAPERRHSLVEALRGVVRLLGYGTAVALSLVSALLLCGSLSMKEIVQAQLDQGQWFVFYVPVGFVIVFAGSLVALSHRPIGPAETDRKIAGRSEAIYGGLREALNSLAEYASIFAAAGIATTVFLGGWLRPLASYRDRFPGTSVELLDVLPGLLVAAGSVYCFRSARRPQEKIRKVAMNYIGGFCAVVAMGLLGTLFARETVMAGVHGAFWFAVKVGAYMYCCFWIRFTFPGLRLDGSTRLGWRILVPVALVNLITAAMAISASQNTGLPMRFTTIVATAAALGTAAWLAKDLAAEPTAHAADVE
jgi:NADH-quinone oxidoreductase subunit H